MSKLEKLTQQQEALIPVVRDRWIKFCLGMDDTKDGLDREKAIEGIRWLYSLTGLSSPFVLTVDSPLAAQYAVTCYEEILKRFGKEFSQKEVWGQVGDRVRDQVWDQVWGQVWGRVGGQVRGQVRGQVGDQVGDQVRGQVRGQVRDQVWDQVRGQVWGRVWGQVRDQVGGQVGGQVWDQVGDQVWDQVGGQVQQEFLYFSYENLAFYGSWGAWFDYYREIGVVHGEQLEKINNYLDYLRSGCFMTIFLDGLAVACRRPSEIHRNQRNDLHNESGPAIAWRDGYAIYSLNGVRFPKDLFERVTGGSMPFQDILAIEDIDQRTQAMRFGSPEEFMRHAGAKRLDNRQKLAADGTSTFYELFMVPKGAIFTQDAYYVLYTCPSTGKQYMSGVEPCKTVAEAMAWKHNVTPQEWERLIPLVTEA